MTEYQDREEIGLSAKPGKGAALFLGVALAVTLAICGWNMRWSSSGPTSVTIIGINGPTAGTSQVAEETDRVGALPVAELVDGR